jgi:Fur family ferric uptake transcriptional regulator
MHATRKEDRKRLRDAGLRATQSRLLVIGYLTELARPATHSEVAEALEDSGLERATVYRNLVDLAEAGLARRSDFGDHVWRFELAHEGELHADSHVHFVCRSCGGVQCLPEDTVEIKLSAEVPRGLQGDIEVNISGTCNTCLPASG